jgi:NAD(P)-dependent dehydrogenase (short-subunit alcohol dehydrogenase family)
MTLPLENKIAVVTGGANGIGRGIVRTLAERGADIIIADMNEKASDEAVAEVEALGRRSLSVPTDVTDDNGTDGMVASALSMYGRVDILVCNAGVAGAEGWWERDEPSADDWDATYAVNVRGVMHSIESVQGHMMERQSGKIVVIASIAARGGSTGPLAHYRASKAAALNVSQAYALKLAPHNINVNTVCPGLLWTEMWNQIAQKALADNPGDTRTARERFDEALEMVPLGREQTPEDIGKVAAFLCSDRAKNITGQGINVDGGIKMN